MLLLYKKIMLLGFFSVTVKVMLWAPEYLHSSSHLIALAAWYITSSLPQFLEEQRRQPPSPVFNGTTKHFFVSHPVGAAKTPVKKCLKHDNQRLFNLKLFAPQINRVDYSWQGANHSYKGGLLVGAWVLYTTNAKFDTASHKKCFYFPWS